jgi:hypothetical protein
MTIWWVNNIARANAEREQLGALAEEVDWLQNLEVGLGDGNLRVDFDIVYGPNTWQLVLSYPIVFPDAPPLVKSRDGARISGHQYGADGELCLEYRPENWTPDVTGAMMIRSAHALLSGENPGEADDPGHVPDGHAVSMGQATRTAFGRFVLTFNDWAALEALPVNQVHKAEIGEVAADKRISARIIRLGSADAPIYQSSARFPDPIVKSDVFVLHGDVVKLQSPPTADDILSCIGKAENDAFDDAVIKEGRNFYLLAPEEEVWTLYWISLSGDEPFVHAYRTLAEGPQAKRLPPELDTLVETKVGIVGCGSLGSKIGMHLARTNVGAFLLVDDDIFFEGNLVRHTLTTSDVGFHKATALRRRMLKINPRANIETRLIRLGGQESSESTVSAMGQLAECALIIDATAEPGAYSFIAAVARRNKLPVVWGSVFAGGIGGTVGRAVPGKTPEPLLARQQVQLWCQSQEADDQPEATGEAAYAAHGEDDQPEIATDADVSVIASHVSRLALDTLSRPENSSFPYSAYVLGLSARWIFSAPFDTRPIAYTGNFEWTADQDAASEEELVEFLKDLLPKEAEGAA